jgi:hypothetical protein
VSRDACLPSELAALDLLDAVGATDARRLAGSSVSVPEEELLAVDLVARDRVLAVARQHPVGERLREVFLHVPVLGGIDDDHAVLVEETLVALTRMASLPRFLKLIHVPRSVSSYASVKDPILSAYPMPQPHIL